MRLSHRDFDAVQRAILELYDASTHEAFDAEAFRIALKVIPGDYAACNTFHLRAAASMARYVESSPRVTLAMHAYSERHIHAHPFTRYLSRTGDNSALKLRDFMSVRQMKNSEAWEHYYRPIGLRDCLSAFDTLSRATAAAFSLVRDCRDFSERDRCLLNLLRPHLTQARRIAGLVSALPKARPLDAVTNGSPGVCRLTLRELEVARWVAEGKTNPEIAIILGASPRTIEKHMENILEKLGVENRTAAAATLIKGPVNFNSAQ